MSFTVALLGLLWVIYVILYVIIHKQSDVRI